MGRSTSKKKASAQPLNSLLNFFSKAEGSARPERHHEVDVKPDLGKIQPKANANADSNPVAKAKSTRRGSEHDPVVISDDEDTPAITKRPKRKRVSNKLPQHSMSTEKAASSPELLVDTFAGGDTNFEPDTELGTSVIAGTSRSHATAGPSRSTTARKSPSPPTTGPPSSPRRPYTLSPQLAHPFPGSPQFSPPRTWPQIVNTGPLLSDPGDPISDDGVTQDPEDDRDDPANDDSGLELDTEESIEMLPVVQPLEHPGALGVPGMEWDEGDDEGMGMEEDDEGGDEASDIVETPPLRFRVVGIGKMTECPICGKSLKGKVNMIVQSHVNNCLDSKPPSSGRPNASRPITSINHSFSPAPSPPSPPPESQSKGPNAFSVLMSGHKEREQWKDAEIDLKRDGKRTFGRRKAPFYKVLTGMPVAVDAFRYGSIPKIKAYLLTHAHSDHYTNLSKSWNSGPIYCSKTTANLIIHMLGVEPQWVQGLPDNIPFEMPNTGGVTVTPLEANHCPGSSIFLFEGPQTVNAGDSGFKSPYVGSRRIFGYLHCGDFRACPKHVLHPAVARAKIDTCYLDTTYLNPKYCFPPQPQVIAACASLARKTAVGLADTAPPLSDIKPDVKPDLTADVKPDLSALQEQSEERSKAVLQGWLVKREEGNKEELVDLKDVKPKGRTLIVMGTYSIGKERIVKAVARALGSKIYCDPRKKGILLCETDPDLHSMLSSDPVEVHLLPLGNIQLDRLQDYLHRLAPHFDRVLGFRPTGWTYTPPAGTDLLPDVNTVIRRDQARSFTDVSLKPMRGSCRQFMMYGVPYSEHSSFFELTCFALSVPGLELKMIATVNVGNEKSRAKMKKWFEKWAAEKGKRKEKGLPAIVEYRDETYW